MKSLFQIFRPEDHFFLQMSKLLFWHLLQSIGRPSCEFEANCNVKAKFRRTFTVSYFGKAFNFRPENYLSAGDVKIDVLGPH